MVVASRKETLTHLNNNNNKTVVAARATNYIRVRAVLVQVMAAPVEEEAAMWAIRVWAVAVAVPSGDSW